MVGSSQDPFFDSLRRQYGEPRWPESPRECVVMGIRHEGKEVGFRENTADDEIILCRLDSDGLPQSYTWPGTTEPGYFKEVINPQGDFKLNPGFYYFKPGTHKGVHPCLVQAAPVRGERAKKGKGFDYTDGQIWTITDGSLHIHAGILNDQNVGNWSAGCQVISGGWGGKPWGDFWKYIGLAIQSGQKIFTYILVDEATVKGVLGK